MGVNLKELIVRRETNWAELKGKTLAIDGYNMLYQFLTTIRGPDGSVFTDHKDRVTSHLIGLFSRTANFLQKGITPIFVFDGEVPKLKRKELDRRKALKIEAEAKYHLAKKEEDVDEMKKQAARMSRLTKEMVEEAKAVLEAMGVSVIQAPSEGEAQATELVKEGTAWAIVSQDYDSLLYGAERVIQNLSIAGKRKKTGAIGYITVEPEILLLNESLKELGINREQLIALAMLVGTDYNPSGVKGIGPKKALALVKKHGDNFEKLFEEAKWNESCEIDWKEIWELFRTMPVHKHPEIKKNSLNEEKLKKLLVDEHDFSTERVSKVINELKETKKSSAQKGLGAFV